MRKFKKVFKNNFHLSQNLNELLASNPLVTSLNSDAPVIPEETPQHIMNALRLIYLGQILVGAMIFTFTANTYADTKSNINTISDEFTLWTNSVLTLNGIAQLIASFFRKPEERPSALIQLNRLTIESQAALLFETASLGGFMFLGSKYLDVQSSKTPMNVALLAIQHTPSAIVTVAASLIHGKKPSDWFKEPSMIFFIGRLLFATTYMLRDGLTKTAGYSTFNFMNQDGSVNKEELGLVIGAFALFVLTANVAAYAMWRALEIPADKIRDCGKILVGNLWKKPDAPTIPRLSDLSDTFQVV